MLIEDIYKLNLPQMVAITIDEKFLLDKLLQIHGVEYQLDEFHTRLVTGIPLKQYQHITEQKFPEQTKRFREILDEMYQTHLEKNADYSPYNILVTGMRGCVTRLWDKSARFFNLMGLDIGTYQWTEEKMNMVEDEDVNQTIIDWANYCVITRILREGKWGK